MIGSRRSNAAIAARYERHTVKSGAITGAEVDSFAELTAEQASIVFEHYLAASSVDGTAGTKPSRGARSEAARETAVRHPWSFVAKVVALAAAATLASAMLLIAFAPRADDDGGSPGSGSSGRSQESSLLRNDQSDPLGTSVWSADW